MLKYIPLLTALLVVPCVFTACKDNAHLQQLACLEKPCLHPEAESDRELLMEHYRRYYAGQEGIEEFPYIAVVMSVAACEPSLRPQVLAMVKELHSRGALVGQPYTDGTLASFYALYMGDPELIAWFTEQGYPPQMPDNTPHGKTLPHVCRIRWAT